MRNSILVFFIAAIAALSPAPAVAQGVSIPSKIGLAWNSVTKTVPNADAWSLQPGDFDLDFAIASNENLQIVGSGGVLGYSLDQLTAMGGNAATLLKSGFAENYYATNYKARIDQPTFHRATIVDCALQTVTTLDLRAKTFDVQPMERYGSPLGDNLHLSLDLVNSALGNKRFAGIATDGYRSVVAITETKKDGDHTRSAKYIAYYTTYFNEELACPTVDYVSNASHGDGFPSLRNVTRFANQLHQILADFAPGYHINVSQTGPPLPDDFPLYEAISSGFDPPYLGNAAFVVERGNLRIIRDDDAVFKVPRDFKRQPSGGPVSNGAVGNGR